MMLACATSAAATNKINLLQLIGRGQNFIGLDGALPVSAPRPYETCRLARRAYEFACQDHVASHHARGPAGDGEAERSSAVTLRGVRPPP